MASSSVGDELSPFLLEVPGLEEAAEKEEKEALRGSYGFVFKVTVGGVKSIAKKLHSAFTGHSRVSARERESITARFRNECIILSKLRHPNIVQFVGVHFGLKGLTLIMESLRSDLDDFLSDNPQVPLSLKLSMLRDVSYGVVYLHDERTPAIIHRDLTARNILIADNCQAKIADLGMAKIVTFQKQLAQSHTQAPGQALYMPPEALTEKAECTPKLDIFSFGHLALFTMIQDYPKVYNVRITGDVQRSGTIERLKRQRSLDLVGSDHCLYPIITECLYDRPEQRPTTRDLNSRLIQLSTQHPVSARQVMPYMGEEMARMSEELKDLQKYESKIQETEDERDKLKEDFDIAREEIGQLKEQFADLEQELLSRKKEATSSELLHKNEVAEAKCSSYEELIKSMREQIRELESEKSGIQAQAEIYKADFEAERADRGRAQGELDGAQEKIKKQEEDLAAAIEAITAMKSKIEALATQRDDLKYDIEQRKKFVSDIKKAYDKLKEQAEAYKADFEAERADCGRSQGELDAAQEELKKQKEELTAATEAIATFKSKIEALATQRDDLKYDIEQRKKFKSDSKKAHDKLKEQLSQAGRTALSLHDQIEGLRKEKKTLAKNLKKAEDQMKKLAKAQKSTRGTLASVSHETKAELLYEGERNANEALLQEIDGLKDEVEYLKQVIESLRRLIKGEDDSSSTSSEKSMASPNNDEQKKGELQNDPLYIPSESPKPSLTLQEQLDKHFFAAKQMTTPIEEKFQRKLGDDSPPNTEEMRGNQKSQAQVSQNPSEKRGAHQKANLPERNKADAASVVRATTDASSRPQPSNNLWEDHRHSPVTTPAQSEHSVLPARQAGQHAPQPFRAGGKGNTQPPQGPQGRPPHMSASPQEHQHQSKVLPHSRPVPGQPPAAQGREGYLRQKHSNTQSEDEHFAAGKQMYYSQRGKARRQPGWYDKQLPSSQLDDYPQPSPHPQGTYHPLYKQHNWKAPDECFKLPQFHHQQEERPRVLIEQTQAFKLPPKIPKVGALSENLLAAGAEESRAPVVASYPLEKQQSQGEPDSHSTAGESRRPKPETEIHKDQFQQIINQEIADMADTVQDELSEDNMYKKTVECVPYDPNLECPLCGKRHRIGEIQKFRFHVDKCEGIDNKQMPLP